MSYYTCSTIKSVSCPNWEVLLGSRSETFTKSASMSVSSETGFSGVTAADINGDGINDIVG
ncbi:MAG: VCBS repeat-containing protein [Candidatus Sulfotelmatobacter sp.]